MWEGVTRGYVAFHRHHSSSVMATPLFTLVCARLGWNREGRERVGERWKGSPGRGGGKDEKAMRLGEGGKRYKDKECGRV